MLIGKLLVGGLGVRPALSLLLDQETPAHYAVKLAYHYHYHCYYYHYYFFVLCVLVVVVVVEEVVSSILIRVAVRAGPRRGGRARTQPTQMYNIT